MWKEAMRIWDRLPPKVGKETEWDLYICRRVAHKPFAAATDGCQIVPSHKPLSFFFCLASLACNYHKPYRSFQSLKPLNLAQHLAKGDNFEDSLHLYRYHTWFGSSWFFYGNNETITNNTVKTFMRALQLVMFSTIIE